MKRERLLWAIIVIQFVFILLLIGYAMMRFSELHGEQLVALQTAIPHENAASREAILSFAQNNSAVLEKCAQDFYDFRVEQLEIEKTLVSRFTLDDSGKLIAVCSQDKVLYPNLPNIRELLTNTMIKGIQPSQENETWVLQFETDYTDGSWDDGFYYDILYSESGAINVEGYQRCENGWLKYVDDDVFYVEKITDHLYYSFEAWD